MRKRLPLITASRARPITRRGVLGLLFGLVLLVLPVFTASVASANTTTYLINDARFDKDADLTDNLCLTANGTCTLRAALEQTNAINRAIDEVLIAVDPAWVATKPANPTANGTNPVYATTNGVVTITLPNNNGGTNRMFTTALSAAMPNSTGANAPAASLNDSNGAYFYVTQPVTIDLQNQLSINSGSQTSSSAAVFFVNGPNITLKGLKNIWSSATSIYVGPAANNVTVTDGATTTLNSAPQRYLLVRGGAQNVTLSYHRLEGFNANGTTASWVMVTGSNQANPVGGTTGLTIDNVQFIAGASGSCNSSTIAGCGSCGIEAYDSNSGSAYFSNLNFTNNYLNNVNRAADKDARVMDLRQAVITGKLVIDNNVIENAYARLANSMIDFGSANVRSATINQLQITNNSFTGMTGNVTTSGEAAAIKLPYNTTNSIGPGSVISGNFFQYSGAGPAAIAWYGPYSTNYNSTLSNLAITGNYFDWAQTSNNSVIYLQDTGLVDVSQNLYSAKSVSQTTTTQEETGTSGAHLVLNQAADANRKLNTWFPTARNSANSQPAPVAANACIVPLVIAPPSDTSNTLDNTNTNQYPSGNAQVDVYWTSANDAEVFLGRFAVSGGGATNNSTTNTQTLQIPLPQTPISQSLSQPATYLDGTGLVIGAITTTVGGTGPLAGDVTGAALTRQTVQTAGPVDPATGAVTGALRLQTVWNGATSQFSRVVNIGGSCRPDLTLNQAGAVKTDPLPAVLDPTMLRDLHFSLLSSVPLDPTSVTVTDFTLTATPAPDSTVATDNNILDKDAALNARIVAITPVQIKDPVGTGTMVGSPLTGYYAFDIVVRMDDSGTATLTLGANTVESCGATSDNSGCLPLGSGLVNQQAATFIDNQITYQNPVQVVPNTLSLIIDKIYADGEAYPAYALGLAKGAVTPAAPLEFWATLGAPPAGVTIEPSPDFNQVIGMAAGSTASNPVSFTASCDADVAAGGTEGGSDDDPNAQGSCSVPPGTPVWVTHDIVTSADPNYAGLIVPPLQILLYTYTSDLTLEITAYLNPADTTSLAGVLAGTPLNQGDRARAGLDTVCFVYDVTYYHEEANDEWATQVNNVEVHTTDTRLMPQPGFAPDPDPANGFAIPNGQDETRQWFACALAKADNSADVCPTNPTLAADDPACDDLAGGDTP